MPISRTDSGPIRMPPGDMGVSALDRLVSLADRVIRDLKPLASTCSGWWNYQSGEIRGGIRVGFG